MWLAAQMSTSASQIVAMPCSGSRTDVEQSDCTTNVRRARRREDALAKAPRESADDDAYERGLDHPGTRVVSRSACPYCDRERERVGRECEQEPEHHADEAERNDEEQNHGAPPDGFRKRRHHPPRRCRDEDNRSRIGVKRQTGGRSQADSARRCRLAPYGVALDAKRQFHRSMAFTVPQRVPTPDVRSGSHGGVKGAGNGRPLYVDRRIEAHVAHRAAFERVTP